MSTQLVPTGRELEVYAGLESAYGTPPATFFKTFVYTMGLRPSRPLEQDPILGAANATPRDETDPAPGLTSFAGSIDVPLDMRHLGLWLYAVMGAPVTTGTTPKSHLFTSGKAVLPSISLKHALGGEINQDVGVVARSMQFALGQEAGYRRVSVEVGGKDRSYPATLDVGTPAAPFARAPIGNAKGLLKLDGVTVANLLGFDATYSTGMEEERFVDGSDTPSAYSPEAPSSFAGSMRVRWLNTALEEQALAGTAAAMTIEYTISTSLKLTLAAPRVFFERQGPSINGPGRIENQVGFRAAQTDAAAMLTATLVNDLTGYFA